ncbi:AAA family ATPase [Variovorax soli]|uniref:AAA family ATPase n=1 Tax=Variovorax soli TaxID=376815 RepID=UPI000A4C6567|nr:AAA family ATPase [Variovorax soli]
MPPDSQSSKSSALPSGYCLHEHEHYYESVAYRMPIALPCHLSSALLEERKQRRIEEERTAEVARLARQEARKVAENAAYSSSASTSSLPPSTPPPIRPPRRPTGTVAVYDWDRACERLHMLRTHPDSPDKQLVKRDIGLFERALKPGPWRQVGLPRNWRSRLQSLAHDVPHFTDVLTFIAQRLALAELARTPLQPTPILLLGEPGVGKTYFSHRLADILGTPVHRESFDNAEHSGSLRGNDRHWANTSIGALFQLVVTGAHANPVVLLDEIDKAAASGTGRNPIDALLTVLEPVSNSRIKDQSAAFEFDASYVWYIATANDARRIPMPVRSRFTEFVIPEPDIDGRLALAHAIYAETLVRLVPRRVQRARFRPLTDLQVCRLAWHTPRQIRMAVERGLGAAALAGRWHIEDSDFDAPSAPPTLARKPATQSRRPGDDPDNTFAMVVLPI